MQFRLKTAFLTIGGTALIISFSKSALDGIVGNLSYSLFLAEWPLISGYILLLVVILTILAIAFFYFKVFYLHLKSYNNIIKQNDSLLKLLANWTPGNNRSVQTKKLLEALLLDAMSDFGEIALRAAILILNPAKDYLECSVSLSMPQECLSNLRFYIGGDGSLRKKEGGAPAEVFLKGEMYAGRIKKVGNQSLCIDCKGKYILPSEPHHFPLYKSFIILPLIKDATLEKSQTECLGIIWLDSRDEKIFEAEETRLLLTTLASRIAAALCIVEKLH